MEPIFDLREIIGWEENKEYYCPYCFNKYKSKYNAINHFMKKCKKLKVKQIGKEKEFIDLNEKKEKVRVIIPIKDGQGRDVNISSQLALFSKRENKDMAPHVNKEEWGSGLFIAFLENNKRQRIIGFLVFRKKETNNGKESKFVFWHIYLLPYYRSKELGTFFMDTIIKNKFGDWSNVVYHYPLTEPMRAILKNKLKPYNEFVKYVENKGFEVVEVKKELN